MYRWGREKSVTGGGGGNEGGEKKFEGGSWGQKSK